MEEVKSDIERETIKAIGAKKGLLYEHQGCEFYFSRIEMKDYYNIRFNLYGYGLKKNGSRSKREVCISFYMSISDFTIGVKEF